MLPRAQMGEGTTSDGHLVATCGQSWSLLYATCPERLRSGLCVAPASQPMYTLVRQMSVNPLLPVGLRDLLTKLSARPGQCSACCKFLFVLIDLGRLEECQVVHSYTGCVLCGFVGLTSTSRDTVTGSQQS